MIGIIHPTDQCNLNCSYCESRKGNNVMDKQTLYNALGFALTTFEHADKKYRRQSLEWHAAEPMTLPISWYESAEKILNMMGYRGRRMMCSNYTLMNEKWAEFLKCYNYIASLSLDGDKYIHDHNRGEGSFDKVISAMILLRKYNIDVGSICVLSEYSCDHWDELYPFFKLAGVHIKINPQIPNNFSKKCAETYINLYDQWYDDKAIIKISPFEEMTGFILGTSKRCRCFIPCGEHIFSVSTNGDVYPCSSFVLKIPMDDYIYGNVNVDTWEDIWLGEKRARFLDFKNTRSEECLECPYNEYCGGGCTRDSVQIGNTEIRMGSTCEIIRPLMDHIAEKVGWLGRV